MKKWSVYGKVVAGKYMGEYEAETKKEAISMALEKEGYCIVCHQCAREVDDPEIVSCIAEEVE